MFDASLIVPAFIAGLLTFLAPCTLPLVPAYLGFVGGVTVQDLHDPKKLLWARRRVLANGALYVLGFSTIFILLGTLFGLGGASLVQHRLILSRLGGAFVMFFGFYMLVTALAAVSAGRINLLALPILRLLNTERRLPLASFLKPGKPTSSFLFGATFAFGWTPCIGPILGSILFLASTSTTVGAGAFLLAVFSLGLAIPFMVIAAGIGSAALMLRRLAPALNVLSLLGGTLLLFMGYYLATNSFATWITSFYKIFDFMHYEKILQYL